MGTKLLHAQPPPSDNYYLVTMAPWSPFCGSSERTSLIYFYFLLFISYFISFTFVLHWWMREVNLTDETEPGPGLAGVRGDEQPSFRP